MHLDEFISLPPEENFLPFLNGKYEVTPGLQKLSSPSIYRGENLSLYLKNKTHCMDEHREKYFATSNFTEQTEKAAIQLLQGLLTSEENDFHRLCMNMAEDVAIVQLTDERDWLAAVHLCSPNHWAAEEKIGKNFANIHEPVPGMEKYNQRYLPMLKTIVKGGVFKRFAWGVATDTRLNHHPDAPKGIIELNWKGRAFDPTSPVLWVRIEQQTLIGMPKVNAFMFLIRTYFAQVDQFDLETTTALKKAINGMSEKSTDYKGIQTYKLEIEKWLEDRINLLCYNPNN